MVRRLLSATKHIVQNKGAQNTKYSHSFSVTKINISIVRVITRLLPHATSWWRVSVNFLEVFFFRFQEVARKTVPKQQLGGHFGGTCGMCPAMACMQMRQNYSWQLETRNHLMHVIPPSTFCNIMPAGQWLGSNWAATGQRLGSECTVPAQGLAS